MPQNTGSQYPLSHLSAISTLLFFLILFIGGVIGLGFFSFAPLAGGIIWVLTFLIAWAVSGSVKVASQWEKAVILRVGRFAGLRGPGIFFIVPFIDTIPYWIDIRTITSTFKAEQTLTKDNVPVDVDAILFWRVVDSKKAALEVADYNYAVNQASQTALRDVIGKTELTTMLSGREGIDLALKEIIDQRTEPWGIEVISVEIRDVIIPTSLQSAMSQQAQAERERQARVILGDSENQIAQKFAEAAKFYENNPTALHLRAMNMLYEGLKEKGALMIVPSSALDSMNLGTVTGLSSIQREYRGEHRQ
jgi:regulator of protease activity HflC (stomatin/prohibitin superfamily)